jgi:hypothetical protein
MTTTFIDPSNPSVLDTHDRTLGHLCADLSHWSAIIVSPRLETVSSSYGVEGEGF